MHLPGYRFAPRIRDLQDTRLYTPTRSGHAQLQALIGGRSTSNTNERTGTS